MTERPQPIPTVALNVVWSEVLALFRWNLGAFLTTARGDDPSDPDGGLAEVESAIASIDRAAAICHGFGPWDDVAHTWTGVPGGLSARSVVASRPVVAWFNAERGPDAYLDRFPADARPFAERAYNDGTQDGASHGETLAEAIRAALDERAGPADNQLAAIRAALEAYEAEA